MYITNICHVSYSLQGRAALGRAKGRPLRKWLHLTQREGRQLEAAAGPTISPKIQLMCKEAPMSMLMYLPAILALELAAELSSTQRSMRGFEGCLDFNHESASNIAACKKCIMYCVRHLCVVCETSSMYCV